MSKLESVKEQLIARIQSGQFAPGQRLIETQLMKELGVSRHIIREALQALAEARLVDMRHNTGASVRRLSRQDVINIYQTREPLEGMAARLCAERATPDDRRALKDLTRDLVKAIISPDVRVFLQLNAAFHARIIACANNPELADLLGRLSIPLMRFQFLALIGRDVIRRSQQDHLAITDAVLAADGDRAETAMRKHVRSSLALVLEELEGGIARRVG